MTRTSVVALSPIAKFAFVLALSTCSLANSANITINTVPVGDVGNPNDPTTGNLYGGVSYPYSIGKYEVTVGQYAEFLNAVATTDTYSLYNTGMAADLNIAGISRSGVSGSYYYSVIGSSNHPASYVGWGDAARFANWLHNGQPTGAQNASTTEDGAYRLNGATTYMALNAVSRNTNAKWFIPSENEWYKAAYYQPTTRGGDINSYWTYPMSTNSAPYSDQPPGTTPDNTRVGNFPKNDNIANDYNDGYAVTGSSSYDSSQNYLTDVGAYFSSPSYYGTFDQGGNVHEWNEAVLTSGMFRGLRGGSWNNAALLSAPERGFGSPQGGNFSTGFRVASIVFIVPEPATSLLAVTASGFYCVLRKRRSRY